MDDDMDDVTCANPNCRAVMGRVVCVRGTELLQMGGGLCSEWHGVCVVCGKEFHWSVRDQAFEKLMKSIKNL